MNRLIALATSAGLHVAAGSVLLFVLAQAGSAGYKW